MKPLEEIRAQLGQVSDPLALLEGIFACAPVGLQIYDASGHCLLVNQAFRNLFGAEPPPEYNVLEDEIAERNGVLDLVHRAFAGETITIGPIWYDPRELTQVRVAGGRRVAILAPVVPLCDGRGKVSHVAIVFKDLTTEIEGREQAEQERDLLRAIFRQSGDGIVVCDEEGIIRGFNPEAERQHGADGKGVPPAQWASAYGLLDMRGQALPLSETPLYRALKGERVENARWMVRRPDASVRILTGTGLPLQHADGSPAGAVVTTRDETERLRLEEDLGRQSATTQRLYEEAQELHRIKDEFLATVSHELRTPLQAILGWARLLQETDEGPARRMHGLATIERTARVQARLVDDMLAASRLVSGTLRLDGKPGAAAAVVGTAGDGAEARSGGSGRGGVFTIGLDLEGQGALAAAPAAVAREARVPGRLSGVRVLVVEDEGDTRDLLSTALGHSGALVEPAASAGEALDALRRRRPDVLVCDIGMPGEDAYALPPRAPDPPPQQGGPLP